MPEYLITKREECPDCEGTRINAQLLTDDTRAALKDPERTIPIQVENGGGRIVCPLCYGEGYRHVQVDADEWLSARVAVHYQLKITNGM